LSYKTASFTVLERGWLSSNNIVFSAGEQTAVVDTGYATHSAQTLVLLQATLQGRTLDVIANTHLHSDHCGGNAILQAHFPLSITSIPPGHASHVGNWDAHALSYIPTGQECPEFKHQGLMLPGNTIQLGSDDWEIHAAPGHDSESIVLFEPHSSTLISADALWENGFGVVFPELEGIRAFGDVAATLDLIEQLNPQTIIPGHGKVFHDLRGAIKRARSRLEQFVQSPLRHAKYAAKVLLKYKLLEVQICERAFLYAWFNSTPYFSTLRQQHFKDTTPSDWFNELLSDLVKSNAAQIDADIIRNHNCKRPANPC
jgi:glyoxylase-like metal-dependent hydrolase (beta-lactamase superfamily II)